MARPTAETRGPRPTGWSADCTRSGLVPRRPRGAARYSFDPASCVARDGRSSRLTWPSPSPARSLPIPNRNAAGTLHATLRPCPSTACARLNRTFSEPKPPATTASPRQLIVTARCEPKCCSAIVRSLTESRTKALAPSSIAREGPLLLSDRAALRRKTLRAPVRRHASDFQRAPERRRIAERGRVPLPAHDLLDR